ncbi:hypothetical protein [Pantoea ananatis]|uniref:hypothetical protein n=1 Tax=Pantoea ananas TaxID=553 RepID=UPI001F4E36B1|nr:hypothetical protein [Pantoea ananatis]MCH9271894.1 hypothetical protein [Pantoea ananatis]
MATKIVLKKFNTKQASKQREKFPDYFELYTASKILKDYDISYSDTEYSRVGDGGVDSFFTFLKGGLIKEDTDYSKSGKNKKIEFVTGWFLFIFPVSPVRCEFSWCLVIQR